MRGLRAKALLILKEHLMRVRTVAAITLSLSFAFILTACGAGSNAQTAMVNQVTDGVDGSINTAGSDLKVRSLLLVAQPDGSAVVVGAMFNETSGSEDLLAISAGGIVATFSKATYPLTQNQPLHFSGDSANAKAVIPQVKIFFSHAGEMTLDALVRDRSGIYSGVTA
jgi:D-arabinose 1-dehydrogenase-like Zn-dependent alcohol dehydrogenase